MSPTRRTLLLVFALSGLVASLIASYVHYQLLTSPSYASFCDVSATVNCSEAYTSQYGSLFGVPVALGGVVFFALVALLAALAGRPSSVARDTAGTYIFWLSSAALVGVIYLGWASYVVLHLFCILCAVTYVSVIALWIVSLGARTAPGSTLPRAMTRDLRAFGASPAALLLALVVVAGSITAILLFPREGAAARAAAPVALPAITPAERAKLETWWDLQPRVTLPVPMSGGAKVQILVFSDYQCPACRAAHDVLKNVMATYDKAVVELVVKHYPLEPECNPGVPTGNHVAACEAAAADVMARGTGRQQALGDWLFENQRNLTKDVVRQAARDQAGIADFDARYAEALQEVTADAALGETLKVRFTPTIYLNGRMIAGNGNGLPPAQAVAGLIDIELARSKQPAT